MADPSDPTQGGEEAYAYFRTVGLPKLVTHLIELQGLAIDHDLKAFGAGVGKILSGLLDDVNKAAVEMAQVADGWIILKMFESHSAKRPLTGNMESHIKSVPGPLGSVRVALFSELDKIINPLSGYGTFWRAQEFGTGTNTGDERFDDIPGQAGRVLYGTFEPSHTRPDASQAGLNVGHDLAFVPGGGDPGFGTISEELPGRHFLRDGSAEAGAKYLARMKEIQEKYIAELRSLLDQAVVTSGGRTFTGIIRA